MTLPQPPGHTTTPPHSPQGTPPEPTQPSTTTGPSTNGNQTKHPPTAAGPSPPNKQPNPGTPPLTHPMDRTWRTSGHSCYNVKSHSPRTHSTTHHTQQRLPFEPVT